MTIMMTGLSELVGAESVVRMEIYDSHKSFSKLCGIVSYDSSYLHSSEMNASILALLGKVN